MTCCRFGFLQIPPPSTSKTPAHIRISAKKDGGYYSVFRDPDQAANSWRAELAGPVISRLRTIVGRDPLGQQFF